VAEVRRIFSATEIGEHLPRVERQERAAAQARSVAGVDEDELESFETPEMAAAQRDRFAALKELLLAERLGTS
jgi:hypothetical protein